MRHLTLACAMLLALGNAWAAEPQGYQAKLTATITIDQSVFAQLGLPAAPGDTSAPATVTSGGKLNWMGGRGRVELQPEGEPPLVTLFDGAQGVLYYLSPDDKTAYKTTLPSGNADIARSLSNPTQAVLDWDGFLQNIRSAPGATVKDLGARKVAGYDCKGVEFTLDLAKAAPPKPGEAPSAMDSLNTAKGTAWVAETFAVPVSIELSVSGITTKWVLSEVKPWTVDEAQLSVPKGYAVKEQDDTLGE